MSSFSSLCSELIPYSPPLRISDGTTTSPVTTRQLFEFQPLSSAGGIAFVGGPVSVLRWHPFKSGICATAAHNKQNQTHEILRCYSGTAHIQLWDLRRGVMLGLVEHQGDCTWDLKWNPDGSAFAAALADGSVLICHVNEKSDPIFETSFLRNRKKLVLRSPVRVVQWSPDGERLMVGCVNGNVEMYEVGTWYKWVIPAQESIVTDIRWLSDYHFCTLGMSCVLRLRDIRDPLANLETNCEGLQGSLSMEAVEDHVAVVGADTGYLRVVRLSGIDGRVATQPVKRVYLQTTPFRDMQAIRCGDNATVLFTGGSEGIVHRVLFPRPIWPSDTSCKIHNTKIAHLVHWTVDKEDGKEILHLKLGDAVPKLPDPNDSLSMQIVSTAEGQRKRYKKRRIPIGRAEDEAEGSHCGEKYNQKTVVTRISLCANDDLIAIGIDGGFIICLPMHIDKLAKTMPPSRKTWTRGNRNSTAAMGEVELNNLDPPIDPGGTGDGVPVKMKLKKQAKKPGKRGRPRKYPVDMPRKKARKGLALAQNVAVDTQKKSTSQDPQNPKPADVTENFKPTPALPIPPGEPHDKEMPTIARTSVLPAPVAAPPEPPTLQLKLRIRKPGSRRRRPAYKTRVLRSSKQKSESVTPVHPVLSPELSIETDEEDEKHITPVRLRLRIRPPKDTPPKAKARRGRWRPRKANQERPPRAQVPAEDANESAELKDPPAANQKDETSNKKSRSKRKKASTDQVRKPSPHTRPRRRPPGAIQKDETRDMKSQPGREKSTTDQVEKSRSRKRTRRRTSGSEQDNNGDTNMTERKEQEEGDETAETREAPSAASKAVKATEKEGVDQTGSQTLSGSGGDIKKPGQVGLTTGYLEQLSIDHNEGLPQHSEAAVAAGMEVETPHAGVRDKELSGTREANDKADVVLKGIIPEEVIPKRSTSENVSQKQAVSTNIGGTDQGKDKGDQRDGIELGNDKMKATETRELGGMATRGTGKEDGVSAQVTPSAKLSNKTPSTSVKSVSVKEVAISTATPTPSKAGGTRRIFAKIPLRKIKKMKDVASTRSKVAVAAIKEEIEVSGGSIGSAPQTNTNGANRSRRVRKPSWKVRN